MSLWIDKALDLTEGYGTRECHLFRQRIFTTHSFVALPLAEAYVRTAKAKGYVEANNQLRQFHERLILGPSFQGIYIDSQDEDVKRFAEHRSLQMSGLFGRYTKRVGLRKAAKRIEVRLRTYGFRLPLTELSEASDPAWWRRQVRKRQEVGLESVCIDLGLVNLTKGKYASNHCVERKTKQWHRNEEILASLEAENDLGQVFNLLDLYKRGVSNLVNRRHELMTRISGFEGYAKDQGDVGVFYTLTAPSKYHAYHSKPCVPNAKYQSATPAETQAYLNTLWTRTRAAFMHAGVNPYGVRVVEPHHDGTPHWHLLLFMAPHEVEAITDIFRRYALAEDSDEAGADRHRFQVEHIDLNKGSAVGYIAKYIAKNIDGECVGADLYGEDAVAGAVRIRAWASN